MRYYLLALVMSLGLSGCGICIYKTTKTKANAACVGWEPYISDEFRRTPEEIEKQEGKR